MIDPLEQRTSEKETYEVVVNVIVDLVNKEFPNDGEARLRIYELIAGNFDGLVRALRAPEHPMILEEIEE